MINPPLLFLDCETLGLGDAPIWEVAAIHVNTSGDTFSYQAFVEHDKGDWLDTLPDSFQQDYEKRYDAVAAKPRGGVINDLVELCSIKGNAKPIVCGSNPSFDMERLEAMAADVGKVIPWHYHAMDIPTLAHGWLLGKGVTPAPPWKSDFISQACGIDPGRFDRHTALGDAQWCYSLWLEVNGA